jgi:hypothetical protein
MKPGAQDTFAEIIDQFLATYCQRGTGFHVSDRQLFAQCAKVLDIYDSPVSTSCTPWSIPSRTDRAGLSVTRWKEASLVWLVTADR